MKHFSKIMLAAVLVAGSGYTVNATPTGQNTAIAKSYQQTTEDRHLSGFRSISISGSYDIYITQGSTESVKVEAPSDVIGKIVTEVEGGVLKIYNKRNINFNWTGNKRMVVYISAKDLSGISLSGSGDVFFKDGIKANKLALSLSGSGDVIGKVDVTTLETSLSGSGDIKLSGRAQTSAVKVVGSGDFTGGDLATQSTSVSVAGSGDARVNASQSVNAAVAGSGDVYYTGGARNISTSKAGSGDVHKF